MHHIFVAIRKGTNKAYICTLNRETPFTDETYAQAHMERQGPAEFRDEFNANGRGWAGFQFKHKQYDDVDIAQRSLEKMKREYEVLNRRVVNFPGYRRTSGETEEGATGEPEAAEANGGARRRATPRNDSDLDIIEAALVGRAVLFNGTKYRVKLEEI